MTDLRAALLGAIIHCAAWLGVELAVESMMRGSACKEIYGLLSGFWAALYIGFVLRVPLSAFVPAAVVYTIALWSSGSASIGFPRRVSDVGAPGLFNTIPWAILFGAPIAINHCVRILSRLTRAHRQPPGAETQ